MNLFAEHLLCALAIGFCTGLFSGMFGIGGGTVSTPLLRLLLAAEPHVAVGTTMALIIPTSISGSLNYIRQDAVDKELARQMVLPAVLGVLAGAGLTNYVNGHALMLLFSMIVGLSGLDVIFGVVQGLLSRYRPTTNQETDNKRSLLIKASVLGLSAGFFAGFFGVGGGFILVPCLSYLFNSPIKVAIGTSLFLVAIISLPGTITHALLGHVDLSLMLSMMGGSIPGSLIGSAMALKLHDALLRRGFGVLMVLVAIGLVIKEISR